ncbi:MAG: hypothetical protein ACK2UM_17660 [Anaerolineales bacterium]
MKTLHWGVWGIILALPVQVYRQSSQPIPHFKAKVDKSNQFLMRSWLAGFGGGDWIPSDYRISLSAK